jgi:hypothetical protein
VLLNYKEYFTKQPGKCKLMRYKFEVTSPEPIVGSTRPTHFYVRAEVRTHIEQLFKDETIEFSDSTFFNPLTIVFRQWKAQRICLDARRANKWTVPDRARVQPIGELLQRFHGSRCICTIDLSSDFLQVELEPESRK